MHSAAQAAQRSAGNEVEETLWEGGYSAKAMMGTWLGLSVASVLAVVLAVVVTLGAALPIVFGMHSLYEWATPEGAADPVIQSKALYLNTPFFLGRQAFYFITWNAIGFLLTKWSAEHDKTGNRIMSLKSRFKNIIQCRCTHLNFAIMSLMPGIVSI